MDIYKGRRVLAATECVKRAPSRDVHRVRSDISFHERLAQARSERAKAEQEDKDLVAQFLASQGKIKYLKEKSKFVRRAQTFGRVTIPAIHVPVIARKGGAVSYCAPRSRG